MICHRVAAIEEVHSTLGKLPPAQIERAWQSVVQSKSKLTIPHEFSEEKFKEIDGEIWSRSPVETY